MEPGSETRYDVGWAALLARVLSTMMLHSILESHLHCSQQDIPRMIRSPTSQGEHALGTKNRWPVAAYSNLVTILSPGGTLKPGRSTYARHIAMVGAHQFRETSRRDAALKTCNSMLGCRPRTKPHFFQEGKCKITHQLRP